MRKLLSISLGLVVLFSYTLSAQEKSSNGPPKRLQLIIEDVKPGRGAAHQKSEEAWLAAFKRTNVPAYGLAMTSMTGRNEAWFANSMGESWAQWDEWGKKMQSDKVVAASLDTASERDGDLINNSRTFYLDYVPELSYRPDFKLGEVRFFMVDTVRVKPGHGKEFSDIRKAVNAAHEKANMDEHMIVYYASLGAAGGTYYIFEPIKSIRDFDEMDKLHDDNSAYRTALGDDFQKMNHEFALNGLLSTESNLLAISPSMSYVSEEVAKAAPDFWNPKTSVMATSKKKGKDEAAGK
jgi:hypothetical protein